MAQQTPKGHGLGYIPDDRDARDFLFAAAPELSAYKFVDLSKDPAMPPVWDQGQLGSCTAHGTLACFLWASAKGGANDPMLSRLQLYYNTRMIEGTVDEDSGGQIRDAIKASAMGVAPETDWPYDIARFADQPSAAAQQDMTSNMSLSYHRVSPTVSSIQACLQEGFPVDIGVLLDPNSFESDEAMSSGLVPLPDESAQLDGHCMAIVGIGTGADWHADGQFKGANLDPETQYGKVRNSWGTQVYEGGYLLMSMDYLASKLGHDYWTIREVN